MPNNITYVSANFWKCMLSLQWRVKHAHTLHGTMRSFYSTLRPNFIFYLSTRIKPIAEHSVSYFITTCSGNAFFYCFRESLQQSHPLTRIPTLCQRNSLPLKNNYTCMCSIFIRSVIGIECIKLLSHFGGSITPFVLEVAYMYFKR